MVRKVTISKIFYLYKVHELLLLPLLLIANNVALILNYSSQNTHFIVLHICFRTIGLQTPIIKALQGTSNSYIE